MRPSFEQTVALPDGVDLHARPAAQFVRTAMGFSARIVVTAGERDMAVLRSLEHGANGEDRAAEVADDDHALAGVGGRDGGAHAVAVGAEPAAGVAAGRLDADVRSRHLTRQLGGARSDLPAVRHDYDPDHALLRFGWSAV